MRIAIVAFAMLLVGLLAALLVRETPTIVQWAVTWQRAFQNEMASAVRALNAGEPGAWGALLLGAGAYGFVHAVGPGHGKYLIGGAGLGSRVTPSRLLGLSVVSSLAQSLWAILLVYGGFFLLEITAQRVVFLAEDVLAPASYAAIAAIGALFVWRGARAFLRLGRDRGRIAASEKTGGCGCPSHGPSPDQAAGLTSLRDAALLVGSIAIRPCTGAIFLLVIAQQMNIELAGAIAVIVMGLGTAALTGLVAISSVAARGIAFFSSGSMGAIAIARPSLEVLAGSAIVWISIVALTQITW